MSNSGKRNGENFSVRFYESEMIYSTVFNKCGLTQHVCNGGTCIDEKYVCDGVINCPDGSDEEASQCGKRFLRCTHNEKQKMWYRVLIFYLHLEFVKCLAPKYFKCGDGKCIHANISLCDGVQDCSDSSDEENCSPGVS